MHSSGFCRLRLADNRYVFMHWHRYLGPEFYYDRAMERPVTDWWEDEAICDAADWFYRRGRKA